MVGKISSFILNCVTRKIISVNLVNRFIVPVSMIVTNDIMAYVFGFFFGKTPLIKLSPKKTWEGFIGGGISTVIYGLVVSISNLKRFKVKKIFNFYVFFSFPTFCVDINISFVPLSIASHWVE